MSQWFENENVHYDEGIFRTQFSNGTSVETQMGWVSDNVRRWRYRTPGFPNVNLRPTEYHLERVIISAGTYSHKGSFKATEDQWATQSKSGPWIYPNYNGVWGTGYISPDLYRSVQISANRANERLKDQDINVGLSVGEAHQTIGMISKRVTQLSKSARDLKKGNIRGALHHLGFESIPDHIPAKTLTKLSDRQRKARRRGWNSIPKPSAREFADGWLELQFGWRPLISDAVGAMKTIDKRLTERPALCTVTGRDSGKLSNKVYRVTWEGESVPGASVSIDVDRLDTTEYFSQVGYTYEITNPAFAVLQQIGLSNPFELAWEAFPFSFIVDWFVNVGQVIGNADSWYGKSFRWGYRTYGKNVSQYLISGKSYPTTSDSSSCSLALSPQHREWIELHREPLGGGLPDRFVVSLPVTTWHAATAISLLKQLFK